MKKLVLGLVIMGICLIGTDAFALVGIDSYTTLMLHFNGVDGSTAFTDSSFSNHTVTANGGAQIDTAQSKFGGASGLFDGNGDYLTIPDSDDWDFGSGNFTVDFWIRWNVIRNSILMGQWANPVSIRSWEIESAGNNLYFGWVDTDKLEQGGGSVWAAETGVWYHIAIDRSGNNLYLFADGTQLGTTKSITGAINSSALNLEIGRAGFGYNFNGWIDELRISKGIARWTSDFTPPTSEYEVATEKVIPEPSTLSLLGLGLLGLVFKKKKIA